MPLTIHKLIDDPRLLLGVAEVSGGAVRPACEALLQRAEVVCQPLLAPGYELTEDRRRAVRSLLKTGGYSPTGRGKPAHEFLLADLRQRGGFNHISGPVDANNVVSLELMLPISLLDSARLGAAATVRIGEPDEGYVFNPSGQRLDVKRCIVFAAGEPPGEPVGSPVKDSMAAKVFDGASGFLGLIYATRELYSEVELLAATQDFAGLLAAETGGAVVQACVY